jgi:hypothetical protein
MPTNHRDCAVVDVSEKIGMRKLIVIAMLSSSPAIAQDGAVKEPLCQPTGRTSKGDLVYSMECRNIPGLMAGTNGYNPVPPNTVRTIPIKPDAVPESK